MWIYIVIAIILVYCLYKERQSLGCGSLFSLDDCDNANGKAIKGSTPLQTDSTGTLYEKIDVAATYTERFVYWRVAYITAIVILLLLYFIIDRRIPSEREFVIGILVIMAVAMFINGFYKFHMSDYAKNNILHAVEILKTK